MLKPPLCVDALVSLSCCDTVLCWRVGVLGVELLMLECRCWCVEVLVCRGVDGLLCGVLVCCDSVWSQCVGYWRFGEVLKC